MKRATMIGVLAALFLVTAFMPRVMAQREPALLDEPAFWEFTIEVLPGRESGQASRIELGPSILVARLRSDGELLWEPSMSLRLADNRDLRFAKIQSADSQEPVPTAFFREHLSGLLGLEAVPNRLGHTDRVVSKLSMVGSTGVVETWQVMVPVRIVERLTASGQAGDHADIGEAERAAVFAAVIRPLEALQLLAGWEDVRLEGAGR